MRSSDSKKLVLGAALMVSFLAVLVAIFLPLFDGGNALNYLDNLYNSISKASANYIDEVQAQVDHLGTVPVELNVTVGDQALAEMGARLLHSAGATATVSGAGIAVQGDLHAILSSALADSRSAYHNRGEEIAQRHDLAARQALHAWWVTLGGMEKALNQQRSFAAARTLHTARSRALECAYNYYGITPQPIGERWGIVLLSLLFYVVYTVWYGYAVMFLFEGMGMKFGH